MGQTKRLSSQMKRSRYSWKIDGTRRSDDPCFVFLFFIFPQIFDSGGLASVYREFARGTLSFPSAQPLSCLSLSLSYSSNIASFENLSQNIRSFLHRACYTPRATSNFFFFLYFFFCNAM